MSTVRTLLLFAMSGAILGCVIASLIAPGFLAWYNTPGATNQALCNLPEVVRGTMSSLIRAQLIGAGSGAVTMLGLGVYRSIRGRARSAASAKTSARNVSATTQA